MRSLALSGALNVVIPAKAGIQKTFRIPDQVRNDDIGGVHLRRIKSGMTP
jgi:hypothetical protein